MKKLLLLLLLGYGSSNAQTQIGADIDGETARDQSGYSVALSSNGAIVAIGAPNNEGSGSIVGKFGSVRVYQNTLGTWTQIGADLDGEAEYDNSGWCVSLSSDGSIMAIGAPFNEGSGYANIGSVRVYKNTLGTWTQIGADIDGEAASAESGWSVSLSGDGTIVAIGAPGNDGNGIDAGSVRVYKNISGIWSQLGADINGEAADDKSGFSVSLSSDGATMAIGAIDNDGSGSSAGSVRVYKNISGTWTQVGADINGEAAEDRSGWSISLSSDGTIVAIGAVNNDGSGSNAGLVRVYKNISGTWTQIGADINGEAAGDLSGNSVSLTSDGTIVAIGAFANAGSGINAGSVRVYQNISGTWTKRGADIDGEATDDYSGNSVSLSNDGTIVAIGAYLNDGSGFTSGSVRVYGLAAVLSSDSFVQANFMLYPNPTTGILNISLQNNLQLEKVNFYNMLGQIVKTATTTLINTSALAKGSYYLEIITTQGKATKQVLVQ